MSLLIGPLMATTKGALYRFKIIFRAGMLSSHRVLACHTVGPVFHIPYLGKKKKLTQNPWTQSKEEGGLRVGCYFFLLVLRTQEGSSCILDVRSGHHLYVPTKTVSELLGSNGEV